MLARYLIPAAAALTLAGCGGAEPQHKSAPPPLRCIRLPFKQSHGPTSTRRRGQFVRARRQCFRAQ